MYNQAVPGSGINVCQRVTSDPGSESAGSESAVAGVLLVSAHNWRAFASFCTECRVFSAFLTGKSDQFVAAVVREEGHGRPP
jgi:hypothetical protein